MLWRASLSPLETGHAVGILNKLNRSYTLVTSPPQGLNTLIAEIHEDDLLQLQCTCGKVHDRLGCTSHKIWAGQTSAYEALQLTL